MFPCQGRCHGGWKYVVLAATFSVNFLCAGMMRCAGVLYASWLNEFNSSASQTGAIASIMSSLSYLACPLAAILCNQYGYRFTCFLGGLFICAGHLAIFYASHLFHMYILCGLIGVGLAMSTLSVTVAVASHFTSHFVIAIGIAYSGIGAGIMAFPPLLHALIFSYGWRGAMLLVGGICGHVSVCAALFCSPSTKNSVVDNRGTYELTETCTDTPPAKSAWHRRLGSALVTKLGIDLLQNYSFANYCLINFAFNFAFNIILVYIIASAEQDGVAVEKSSVILTLLGCGSLLGRALSGGISKLLGLAVPVMYTSAVILMLVGTLCVQLGGYRTFLVTAGIMGLGSGTIRITGIVYVREMVGLSNYANGLGISFLFGGFGDLAGPIAAGVILDRTDSFSIVYFVVSGILILIVLQMLLMPLLRRYEREIPNRT